MRLSDITTIMNATEEIQSLRAALAKRDAQVAQLTADNLKWQDDCAALLVNPAEPRTDAEWKAADRRKRINDLAARYAGEGMRVIMDDSTGNTVRRDTLGVVHCARALAAAVVEAEE